LRWLTGITCDTVCKYQRTQWEFQLQGWVTEPCDICCSLRHLLLSSSSPAATLLGSLFSFCPSIPMWLSGLIWLDRPVCSAAHACVETSGRKLREGNWARRMAEAERLRKWMCSRCNVESCRQRQFASLGCYVFLLPWWWQPRPWDCSGSTGLSHTCTFCCTSTYVSCHMFILTKQTYIHMFQARQSHINTQFYRLCHTETIAQGSMYTCKYTSTLPWHLCRQTAGSTALLLCHFSFGSRPSSV